MVIHTFGLIIIILCKIYYIYVFFVIIRIFAQLINLELYESKRVTETLGFSVSQITLFQSTRISQKCIISLQDVTSWGYYYSPLFVTMFHQELTISSINYNCIYNY